MNRKLLIAILFLFIGAKANTQPVLISPLNNSIICPDSVMLDWSDVPGAISYRVQVLMGAITVLDVSGIVESRYLIPAGLLINNTSYYWRVNVVTGTGNVWSPYWTFTISYLPPYPTVLPINGGNPIYPDRPIIFYWHHVPGATSYRIQISTSPPFTNPIINQVVTDTFYIVPSGTFNYYALYYWRVNAMNICGQSPFTTVWSFTTLGPSAVRTISSIVPAVNRLYNNYPNPFNPSTNIKFDVAKSDNIKIVVYDATGREVRILVNEYLKSGTYEISFDGSTLNSGIFYCKITIGEYSESKKMILLK